MTSFCLTLSDDNTLQYIATSTGKHSVVCQSELVAAATKLNIAHLNRDDGSVLLIDGKPINLTSTQLAVALESDDSETLAQVDGHFVAILIADNNIYIANDKYGAKTWYWQRESNYLLLSSAQHLLPITNSTRNPISEKECFKYRWITQQRTLFAHCSRMRFASTAIVSSGRINEKPYFELPLPKYKAQALSHFVSATKQALYKSLNKASKHYPCVAVFLSGGVDSSILAALAKETYDKIYLITPVFQHGENPELATAKEFASTLNIEPILVPIDESTLIDDMKTLIKLKREPIRHYSSLALMAMMRAVPDDAKAIVYGEAADTLFGSNGMKRLMIHTRWHNTLRFVPQFMLNLISLLKPEHGQLLSSIKNKSFVTFFNQLTRIQYSTKASAILGEKLEMADLEADRLVNAQHGNKKLYRHLAQSVIVGSDVQKHFEEMEYIANLHNKAVISPFFDPDVIKISSQLPDEHFFGGSHVKPVLRELACQFFSRDSIYQRKYGFPVPFVRWLEVPLRSLVNDVYNEEQLFDAESAKQLLLTEDYELIWFYINWQLLNNLIVEQSNN